MHTPVHTIEETAVFGGGCFWCTEAVFSRLKGVIRVTSGYAGGKTRYPTYEAVSEEATGHAEVVQVVFDPAVISYEQLLDVFWHVHDPTTLNQQGADVGTHYRSIILYTSDKQKEQATESLQHLQQSHEFSHPIVTTIEKLDQFFPAETYHQGFYEKNREYLYCSIVIDPKIKKLLTNYNSLLQ